MGVDPKAFIPTGAAVLPSQCIFSSPRSNSCKDDSASKFTAAQFYVDAKEERKALPTHLRSAAEEEEVVSSKAGEIP